LFRTKNERDPPLFTGKLLIKFQNILRNTTQVIIRHRVKILFSVISSPITRERGGYILVSCVHSNTSLFLLLLIFSNLISFYFFFYYLCLTGIVMYYIINSITKSYILNIKIRPLVTEYALRMKLVGGTSSSHSFNLYAYFDHSWSYVVAKGFSWKDPPSWNPTCHIYNVQK
jgi:hypothetical protein